MDRLKKSVEEFRLKVRKFVNRNWHNDPEGDSFRSLDVLYILGGVRYKPTHRWQRICWNTYHVVAVCNFLFFVSNLLDVVPGKFDVAKLTWHSAAVLTLALCYVKDSILNQNFESIQAARDFINGKPYGSGDARNDSACRKKLFQRLQLIFLVLFLGVLTDEIIITIPNAALNELYGTPRILQRLGPDFASGIHFLFLFTICPIWINKYSAGSVTICSLLYGFETEYEIFVSGFENILDNVYSAVEENLPDNVKAAPEWKRYKRDELFWKYLEQHVNDQVKLHIQFVEHMQLLEPIVQDFFAVIYYHAMVLFSPMIYIMMFYGISLASFFLTSGIALNLIECFAWCSIIEAYQDINESFEVEIMDLLAKIPHSQMHHKKYAEIRSTLFIMKTFVRNHEPFSCGGVFPITVEVFAELLDIGYTVVTFLRDMGKKF